MFEAFAFTSAMLVGFIMTSARRNIRLARRHPTMMVCAGYTMVGLLGSISIALFACVALGVDPVPIL